MDLHKLDHLIAVAEEGSFTRAAARLHLSQQALSTSVRALEREVGVPLLARDTTGVTPLPAGHALIEDARVLHGVARAALHRARQIGRGETETLRIGHTPAVTGEEISALLHDAGAGPAEVHPRYPDQLVGDLLGGDLDLGLCRGIRPPSGLARTTVTTHRLRIAVPAGHRLAEQSTVDLSELAGERFVVWGEPGASGYTDFLVDACRRAGFEPRTTRSPTQGTPPVTAVVGTEHVAFVTAPAGPAADGQVHVLDLTPALSAPLHAIWSPHTASAARDTVLTARSD